MHSLSCKLNMEKADPNYKIEYGICRQILPFPSNSKAKQAQFRLTFKKKRHNLGYVLIILKQKAFIW